MFAYTTTLRTPSMMPAFTSTSRSRLEVDAQENGRLRGFSDEPVAESPATSSPPGVGGFILDMPSRRFVVAFALEVTAGH
jgi:hypothetical protein